MKNQVSIFLVVLLGHLIADIGIAQPVTSDSLPSYAETRRWEISRELQVRFSRMRHDFPEEYRAYYVNYYSSTFLRLKKALEKDGLIINDTLDGYVNSILSNLNTGLDQPIENLICIISKNPMPNGRSLGNGIIELHYGTFRILQNKHELAFILAHELAHEYFDHLHSLVDTAVTLYNTRSSKSSNTKDTPATVSPREQKGTRLKQAAYRTSGISRKLETQADSLAFQLMSKAGYITHEAATVLKNLDTYYAVDSNIAQTIINSFEFPEFEFDESWLEIKQGSVQPAGNRFSFEPDSLDTHPSFAIRLGILLDQFGEIPHDKLIEHDTLLAGLQFSSRMQYLDLLYWSNLSVLGLYETLKFLKYHPEDTMHIDYAARYLFEIHKYKRKLIPPIFYTNPNPNYPLDYQIVLSFCHNLSMKEFATLCMSFYEKHETAIHPQTFKNHADLHAFLNPKTLTYDQWRAEQRAKRKSRDNE